MCRTAATPPSRSCTGMAGAILVERFGVIGFPTTLVLDRRGQIVDKIVGPTTARELSLKLAAVDTLAR